MNSWTKLCLDLYLGFITYALLVWRSFALSLCEKHLFPCPSKLPLGNSQSSTTKQYHRTACLKNEQLNQALLGPIPTTCDLCMKVIPKQHVRNIDHWTNYWFETTITKGYFISQEPIIHLHLVWDNYQDYKQSLFLKTQHRDNQPATNLWSLSVKIRIASHRFVHPMSVPVFLCPCIYAWELSFSTLSQCFIWEILLK